MDTTSNALSRILHLLAQHPDVQEKLRAEIIEAQGGDRSDIAYDDLIKLPYLDAICRETLRLYAPVPLAGPRLYGCHSSCTPKYLTTYYSASKDIVVPLSRPVRGCDGRDITEIFIPRGTTILTNIQASNADKVLWGDDAMEWKPERWLTPLPAPLEDARIPGVYAHL